MRAQIILIGFFALGCEPVVLPQEPLPVEPAELAAPDDSPDPSSDARTPPPEAFRALFGEVITLDETPLSTGPAVEWEGRATAVGTAIIGLEVGPAPRTFPLTRTIVVLPRNAQRELAVTPEATVLRVGDRVRLHVPAQDPHPVWVEGVPSLDDASPGRLRPADDAPSAITGLAPTLAAPETSAGGGATLVTYWLTASQVGRVPIELPLMYSAPELEVVPSDQAVEAFIDLTGRPRVAPIRMHTVRVGDRVGVRYMRP